MNESVERERAVLICLTARDRWQNQCAVHSVAYNQAIFDLAKIDKSDKEKIEKQERLIRHLLTVYNSSIDKANEAAALAAEIGCGNIEWLLK